MTTTTADRALLSTPRPAAQPSLVEVRDLTVGWGDVVLERNVSFSVERGEIFVILGSSGSGKSTLLRFMLGLEYPTCGDVRIGGRPVVALEGERPPFGVTFQSAALFGSMSLADNVAMPLREWTDLPEDAIAAIVRAKLRLVGLENAGAKLPAELSGGMKKRAAIARALALEPELVFLDEPSAGLDPVTSAGLDDLILTFNRALGLTFVVVTHELESIFRIAHRCIMLDKETQSVIASGDPRALRDSPDPRVRGFFSRESKRSAGEG